MIPFLQSENLSKRFGEQLLFEDISFTIFEHQKVAIIARNGAGKTTLMEILAGNDTPESDHISKTSDVRISYLKQIPDLNEDQTDYENVFQLCEEIVETIRNCGLTVKQNNKEDINKYTEMMKHHHAWD